MDAFFSQYGFLEAIFPNQLSETSGSASMYSDPNIQPWVDAILMQSITSWDELISFVNNSAYSVESKANILPRLLVKIDSSLAQLSQSDISNSLKTLDFIYLSKIFPYLPETFQEFIFTHCSSKQLLDWVFLDTKSNNSLSNIYRMRELASKPLQILLNSTEFTQEYAARLLPDINHVNALLLQGKQSEAIFSEKISIILSSPWIKQRIISLLNLDNVAKIDSVGLAAVFSAYRNDLQVVLIDALADKLDLKNLAPIPASFTYTMELPWQRRAEWGRVLNEKRQSRNQAIVIIKSMSEDKLAVLANRFTDFQIIGAFAKPLEEQKPLHEAKIRVFNEADVTPESLTAQCNLGHSSDLTVNAGYLLLSLFREKESNSANRNEIQNKLWVIEQYIVKVRLESAGDMGQLILEKLKLMEDRSKSTWGINQEIKKVFKEIVDAIIELPIPEPGEERDLFASVKSDALYNIINECRQELKDKGSDLG